MAMAQIDLEAALVKARLHARIDGGQSEASIRLGDFELLRCIGKGGMGTVFEARDRRNGERVAVKVLHDPGPEGLQRLKREFRALSDLSHERLVTMYGLDVADAVPFLTMALIDGVPLREHLTPGPRLDRQRALECLRQLAEGVMVLHAAGTVHGDLKPGNVLVRRDGQLVLVDFGLARALHEHSDPTSSGTRAYMAPERKRGLGSGPQADWYSVGAIIHALLQGAPPGGDRDPLRALADGLLEADPAKRFGQAQVCRALGIAAPRVPSFQPATSDLLVGRDAELSRLQQALASVAREPVVCAVHGDAGVGKSALVEHFLGALDPQAVRVLRGRCYEGELLPYKGLDGVIEGLAESLSQLPETERATLLPPDTDTLVQVFPVLRRGLPERTFERVGGDPRTVRRRAFRALSLLLGRIAERIALVVYVDDLHWGDPDAAALLEHLLLGPQPVGLLFIGSHRRGLGEHSGCIEVLQAAARARSHLDLPIEPLPPEAAAELARQVSRSSLDDGTLATLVREAQGNPLFLRALVQAGPLTLGSTPGARSFQDVVASAIGDLGEEARVLLELCSLTGRPVPEALLSKAVGDGGEPGNRLAELRGRRLLRSVTTTEGTKVSPYHDRVREAVVDMLGEPVRRAHHVSLAAAAHALHWTDAEFLFEQHYRGGQREQAGQYAERAGDHAVDALALQRAREFYALAMECSAPRRPAALLRKLADAAAFSGDPVVAAPLYLEAAPLDPEHDVELQQRAAQMYLQTGLIEDAMALIGPVLKRVGVTLPGSGAAVNLSALLSLLQVTRLQRRLSRGDGAPTPWQKRRIEMAFRIGFSMIVADPPVGAALQLQSAVWAALHGSAAQRGRSLACYAFTCSMFGFLSDARQDALIARAKALSLAEPDAHGVVLCYEALTYFSRGRYEELGALIDASSQWIASHTLESGFLLSELNVLWAFQRVMTGRFSELRTLAPVAEREAEERANRYVLMQIRAGRIWSSLARGQTDEVRDFCRDSMREWKAEEISSQYCYALWIEWHRLLYEGNPWPALRSMQREAAALARSGFERIPPTSVGLRLTRAVIELACSAMPGDELWRSARKRARELDKLSVPWARPSAALIHGGIARTRGRTAEALAHFEDAQRDFEALSLRGYAAAAAYRAAELRGDPHPERATSWFAEQEIAEPAKWTRIYAP